jgi:hypothetical protein
VAEALRPGATATSVVDACLALAKDGTRQAIEAVCEVAGELDGWRGGLERLREAVEPYDTVGAVYTEPGLGARRPSRLHSIEELPIALGLLVATGGDHRETVLGGVNYGRDSDSIGTMGGAIAGALGGRASVPDEWVEQISAASRIDIEAPGAAMAGVACEIWGKDVTREQVRARTLGEPECD